MIRWKPGELSALKHEASLYNRRAAYAERKNPDLFIERINTRAIGRDILARSDAEKLARRINRGTAETFAKTIQLASGIEIPKAELQRLERNVRSVNEKRARQAELKGIKFEPGKMGSYSELRPITVKPGKITDAVSWKKFAASMEKQSSQSFDIRQAEQFKKNYIKAINKALGKHGKEFAKFIKKQSAKDLAKAFIGNNDLSIDTVYEGDLADDLDDYADILINLWIENLE